MRSFKLSAEEKKEKIKAYRELSPQIPITWLSSALGLSRKCLKDRTEEEKKKEAEREKSDTLLKEKMDAILYEAPLYGYRKMHYQLEREGTLANEKRVYRVMKKFGLTQKKKKRFTKTTDSNHSLTTYPNLIQDIVPDHPFHIIAGDITYVRLAKGFCYVAMLIDIFTRKVVGWAVETHMETSLVLQALDRALEKGIPVYHHSDRGGQYCASEYVNRLKEFGIKMSMADQGMSVDNPYAESMNKTLKTEEVYLKDYDSIEDARESIGAFIDCVYNAKRLHSSIGYMPPDEFEMLWLEKQKIYSCALT